MLWILNLALALDVAVKVHDRDGQLSGVLEVDLQTAAGTTKLQLKDDGVDPDVVPGDHLYTAKALGLNGDSGTLKVSSNGKTWAGEFMFEDNSDPVILIGLEAGGRANASTHEVMFFPDQQGGIPGGQPGGPPGNMPPGTQPGTPPPGTKPGGPMMAEANPSLASTARDRGHAGPPKGLWLGFGVLGGIFAGLGALAWTRKTPRIPGLNRPLKSTGSKKGVFEEGALTDLWVGGAPEGALAVEPGPWTPEEIALAALAVAPVRVVVGDATQVVGEFEALQKVLDGRVELLWINK